MQPLLLALPLSWLFCQPSDTDPPFQKDYSDKCKNGEECKAGSSSSCREEGGEEYNATKIIHTQMGWDPTADAPLACYSNFPLSGPLLSFVMVPNTFRNDSMALRNAKIRQ